jgi:hypothetical protein
MAYGSQTPPRRTEIAEWLSYASAPMPSGGDVPVSGYDLGLPLVPKDE